MRTWQHFLAAADRPASAVGLFTAYQLDTVEYVGTVNFPLGIDDARQWLREQGYERHGLAAAKYHPEPHRSVDFGSWRRVPDEHPSPTCRATACRGSLGSTAR